MNCHLQRVPYVDSKACANDAKDTGWPAASSHFTAVKNLSSFGAPSHTTLKAHYILSPQNRNLKFWHKKIVHIKFCRTNGQNRARSSWSTLCLKTTPLRTANRILVAMIHYATKRVLNSRSVALNGRAIFQIWILERTYSVAWDKSFGAVNYMGDGSFKSLRTQFLAFESFITLDMIRIRIDTLDMIRSHMYTMDERTRNAFVAKGLRLGGS